MAVPRIENAVALHIILVAAVGLGLFVSRRMIDPARLLVPCNDNSISLPLKQETVTTAHIIAYICLIPPLIILITEFLRWHLDDEEWLPVKQMTLFSLWVPKLVQSLYICIGNFLYGAALTMMTVELGKKIAGRLRPHFIDACKPTNLVQFCEASRSQQYTVDLICSNKRGEINARESFPSAHAAASFYIAVYLLTYLQLRMSWKSVIVPVMRPMMQFAFIQVAFVIALTRVRDHYHFYSDVAAGAILGILCAFITYFEKIFYLKQLGQTKGFLKTILPLTSNEPRRCEHSAQKESCSNGEGHLPYIKSKHKRQDVFARFAFNLPKARPHSLNSQPSIAGQNNEDID
ncbi:phospholipid phosphatase 3-like isoform X2 [Varroa jacobsoni]|uniref:phospholipid phosphatase 3-like isoform X2 n=1 Tax=Varroa jacobsoni TaxID=62625 RepID=UPI000BF9B2E6|nr:phospholipid phosphatase 3-like isoform X2 [Varroa jacobsoni]